MVGGLEDGGGEEPYATRVGVGWEWKQISRRRESMEDVSQK